MKKTRPAKRAVRRRALTIQETSFLKDLLLIGHSLPEIAKIMNRSTSSIRRHTDNLIRRYNVKNRFQLMNLLLRNEIFNQRRPALSKEQQMAERRAMLLEE